MSYTSLNFLGTPASYLEVLSTTNLSFGTGNYNGGTKGSSVINNNVGQSSNVPASTATVVNSNQRISSVSFGNFWYGNSTNFPGFLYKKNVGVGGRRSTKFTAGGNRTTNTYQNTYNKYTPGSGIGGNSVATRRAKMRLATSCNANQNCGKFYVELGQNQIRPSQYTTYNANFS